MAETVDPEVEADKPALALREELAELAQLASDLVDLAAQLVDDLADPAPELADPAPGDHHASPVADAHEVLALESLRAMRDRWLGNDADDVAFRRMMRAVRHLEQAWRPGMGPCAPDDAAHAANAIARHERAVDPAGLGRIAVESWAAAILAWRGIASARPGRPYSWASVLFELQQAAALTGMANHRNLETWMKRKAKREGVVLVDGTE